MNKQKIKCLFEFHDWETVVLDVIGKTAATIKTIEMCRYCQYYTYSNNFPNTHVFWEKVIVCYRRTGRTKFSWEEVDKLSKPFSIWGKVKKVIEKLGRKTWP